uniref:Global nitrogen transcriptional regulator n=1 Tax=Caloglossa intermedia TaxID=100879 RepID=A0A1Z1M716_9FLOR|nr:global nitrogen transcriptional regulator [Caloglossa intermedia]ARW61544.1 global nitrogen transcriptional regulator [Caloglossa intermedia]
MEWINNLSRTQIFYYVYKLNTNDSLVYFDNLKQNQYVVILEGTVCILKIFNNKKVFFVSILNKNHLLNLIAMNKNSSFYYKIIAMNKTYVISFAINTKSDVNPRVYLNIIKAQGLTLKKYEIINCILKQQYYKYKIIQIILFLFTEFGTINKKHISLSFQISQKKLALITGVNKTKINQVINVLVDKKIIPFSSCKTIQICNIYRLFFLYCY